MIKHIVMWKFKEGEHDNMLIFRDRLLALKGQIPEIRAMEVGINMNPSDRSFDAVLVSEFDSLEALKAYSTNPAACRGVEVLQVDTHRVPQR